jgi:hypothetical protein
MVTSTSADGFLSRASAIAAGLAPYFHLLFVVAVSVWFSIITRWELSGGALFLGCYLMVWSGASLWATTRRRPALLFAAFLTAIALLPFSFQFVRRLGFVLRNGGMDCTTCQASPLLFLINWIIESSILFPGLVAAFLLLHAAHVRKVNT